MADAKRQPWIKFYPSDWRADPCLRMCGLSARGLWMEMLALMHEGEPYGHLTINGRQITEKQLATLVGCPLPELRDLLAELSNAGVFSKTDQGVIYSRRMERDKAKAEYDRENGKGGGNPKLRGGVNGGVNPSSNPPVIEGDKAQKPEARSQKLEARLDNNQAQPATSHAHAHEKPTAHTVGPKCLELLGWKNDPTKNYGPVFQWLADGADPERHIYPVIEAAVAANRKPNNLTYFTKQVHEAMARPVPAVAPPPPERKVYHYPDGTPVPDHERDWFIRIDAFMQDGKWFWPPRPGQHGCPAPKHILERFGPEVFTKWAGPKVVPLDRTAKEA